MKLRHRITSAVSIILILLFPLETVFAQTNVLFTGSAAADISGNLPEWIVNVNNKQEAEWLLEVNYNTTAGRTRDGLLASLLALGSLAHAPFLIEEQAENQSESLTQVGVSLIASAVIFGILSIVFGSRMNSERALVVLSDLEKDKKLKKVILYQEHQSATIKIKEWLIKTIRASRGDTLPPAILVEYTKQNTTSNTILMVKTKVIDDVYLDFITISVNEKDIQHYDLTDNAKYFDKNLRVPLELGQNNIVIKAIDWCGRTSTKSFSVFRKCGTSEPAPEMPRSPIRKGEVRIPEVPIPSTAFYPPLLSIINIGFMDESKDEYFDAGEGGVLSFDIQNEGKGEATEVDLIIDGNPESGISLSQIDIPERLSAGETARAELFFIATAAVPTSTATIRLQAVDKASNSSSLQVNCDIKTRSRWSDVDVKIPKGMDSNRYGIAVIIGNGNYTGRDVYPVDFALQDAETMKKYVKETLRFQEDNILFEKDVTLAELRSLFGTEEDSRGKLYNMVRPDVSDVFIFYSGHGAPGLDDKQGYILPVNVAAGDAQMNGYPLELLTKNISQIPARSITVVIDACFTGLSEQGFMIPDASPGAIRVKYPHLQIPNGSFFLAAASDQIASWFPEMKHGLFTYYFLKGLRGEADKNQDRKITSAELQRYLQEEVPYKVRRLNGRDQIPEIILSNPDMVIVRY